MPEQMIDPNTFTIPELLKILRKDIIELTRDINILKDKLDNKSSDTESKILAINSRIDSLERIIAISEGSDKGVDKSMKFVIWVVVIITALGNLITVYNALIKP
jgi:hypothetical protein